MGYRECFGRSSIWVGGFIVVSIVSDNIMDWFIVWGEEKEGIWDV